MMQFKHSRKNTLKIALVLSSLFVVLLVNSYINARKIAKLEDEFVSIFEDRLVVESYVYELSNHVFQKRMSLNTLEEDEVKELAIGWDYYNKEIEKLLDKYGKTKLTRLEAETFEKLKIHFEKLKNLELEYQQNPGSAGVYAMENELFQAGLTLNQLSTIQISEGKVINEYAVEIISGSTSAFKMEMVLLFIIGILLHFILLNNNMFLSRNRDQPNLN